MITINLQAKSFDLFVKVCCAAKVFCPDKLHFVATKPSIRLTYSKHQQVDA